MIFRIIILGAVTATAAVGYFVVDKIMDQRCSGWLQSAENLAETNYYAASMETLALYFSEDRCRSATDAQAISLLSQTRPHVPLPDGAHLAQQMVLAKAGWRLGRDRSAFLAQASAAMAAGDWVLARDNASRGEGLQAKLIEVGANIRLEDWTGLERTLANFDTEAATPFQRAMLRAVLADTPVQNQMPAPESLLSFAQSLISRDNTADHTDVIAGWKNHMGEDDLATASILLVASGRETEAIQLLDQPDRRLPPALLTRLSRLLWASNDFDSVAKMPLRAVEGTIPGSVQFAACLAQLRIADYCSVQFDEQEYRKRHGAYAAGRWEAVLSATAHPTLQANTLLDALASMRSLVADDPIAQQFAAQLYREIGEPALAARHARRAALFGLTDCSNAIVTCDTVALPVSAADKALLQATQQRDLRLTPSERTHLRANSPQEATLWRLVDARAALAEGSDQGAANALRLLRPVLRWAPRDASANLLAATASAHFADWEAAYGHLADAVKNEPNSSIAALRLSVGYYQASNGLRPKQIVHWWTSLTRLELMARGQSPASAGNQLFVERLSILAAVAERIQDRSMAVAVYDALLSQAPDNHMALNNLAVHLAKQKDELDRAQKLAARAVALAPEEREYQRTLQDIQLAMAEVAS